MDQSQRKEVVKRFPDSTRRGFMEGLLGNEIIANGANSAETQAFLLGYQVGEQLREGKVTFE